MHLNLNTRVDQRHRIHGRLARLSLAVCPALAAMVLGWLAAPGNVEAGEMKIEKASDTITIRDGERTLLEYQQTPNPYKVYVRAFATPGGLQILRDSPHDHVHHHAMMYAIGADGVDFWIENPAAHPGKQIPRSTEARIDGQNAIIKQAISWVDAEDSAHLEEARTLTLQPSAVAGANLLTWDSRFRPSKGREAVELWGRHYFGLGVRFVTSMDNVGSLMNASGQEGESVRGTEQLVQADWCAYTASVDGKPVTIAMFDHPDNAPHRATWFTMTKSFAYLAATLNLAKEPIQLAADQTMRLRYGIALWDGEIGREQIQEAFQRWIGLGDPKSPKLPDGR